AARLAAWIKARGVDAAAPPEPHAAGTAAAVEATLADHVVVIGGGRVGSEVAEMLRQAALAHVVVDRDGRVVEDLRKRGVIAVYGDATRAEILRAAQVSRARL